MPDEPLTLDERVARALVEEDDRVARLIAQDYGKPPSTHTLSQAKELELWMERDTTFDPVTAWQEHLLAGTDPWNAKTDIALRMYPHRRDLMRAMRPKVKEQIAYANRMAERARRAAAEQTVERQTQFTVPSEPASRGSEGRAEGPVVTPGPVPIPMLTAAPMTAPPTQFTPSGAEGPAAAGVGQPATASPLEQPPLPMPRVTPQQPPAPY